MEPARAKKKPREFEAPLRTRNAAVLELRVAQEADRRLLADRELVVLDQGERVVVANDCGQAQARLSIAAAWSSSARCKRNAGAGGAYNAGTHLG